MNKPECATFEEWDQWHLQASREHPVRYFLTESLPIAWARFWYTYVHEPWYWFKCRVWHRYNVVVCRDLPPTWNDRDNLLLFASFQILKDFVEKEKDWHVTATREELLAAYEVCGPEDAGRRADTWGEVKALYDWWNERRHRGIDDDFDAEDNAMLHRLIAVRRVLWT